MLTTLGATPSPPSPRLHFLHLTNSGKRSKIWVWLGLPHAPLPPAPGILGTRQPRDVPKLQETPCVGLDTTFSMGKITRFGGETVATPKISEPRDCFEIVFWTPKIDTKSGCEREFEKWIFKCVC